LARVAKASAPEAAGDASALGIDIGVTGARAAVVSGDGRVLGRGRAPCDDGRFSLGRAEHDAGAWVGEAIAAARQALSEAGVGVVSAVGVAALGPAPILVDAELRPLTPALLFSFDQRAEPVRRRLTVELGLSGGDLPLDNAVPKLMWWREQAPDLWARAAWALDATGFLVAALTGGPAMDTITAMDYAFPGIPSPIPTPKPADPFSVAGGLAADAARKLGLAVGTPVTVGTYDSYVDLAAVGARAPGDACILLGSTLVLCRVMVEPVECQGLGLRIVPYPGRGYLLAGWTASAGSTLDWVLRTLGADAQAEGLAKAADELEPGSGGLLALPYLAGERAPVWDPDARGAVVGLTAQTTREELYRAFVDAVALSCRDLVERFRLAGQVPGRWRVGGGGVRNQAWLRATCDAVGAPFDVVDAGDGVAAALLALRAVGVHTEAPTSGTVEPNPGRRERFDRLYGLYGGLRDLLPETMHALGDLARG
jgi:xylulokinase